MTNVLVGERLLMTYGNTRAAPFPAVRLNRRGHG